jgi:hypothetical protein
MVDSNSKEMGEARLYFTDLGRFIQATKRGTGMDRRTQFRYELHGKRQEKKTDLPNNFKNELE